MSTKMILVIASSILAAFLLGLAVGKTLAPRSAIAPQPAEVILPRLPDAEVIDDDQLVACTMDAKICPDGSAVGRVPPSCEFAPCPGE